MSLVAIAGICLVSASSLSIVSTGVAGDKAQGMRDVDALRHPSVPNSGLIAPLSNISLRGKIKR